MTRLGDAAHIIGQLSRDDSPQTHQFRAIGEAFTDLEIRLEAIERCIAAIGQKTGITPADVGFPEIPPNRQTQMVLGRRGAVESAVSRILS